MSPLKMNSRKSWGVSAERAAQSTFKQNKSTSPRGPAANSNLMSREKEKALEEDNAQTSQSEMHRTTHIINSGRLKFSTAFLANKNTHRRDICLDALPVFLLREIKCEFSAKFNFVTALE